MKHFMRHLSFFRKELFPVLFALITTLCTSTNTDGQQQLVHMHRFYTQAVDRSVASVDSIKHQSIKPYLTSQFDMSKVVGYSKDSVKYYYWITAKLFREHLFEIDGDDFHFSIDPLFDFSLGEDFADTTDYADSVVLRTNTRGLLIQGDIGTTFSFQTAVIETQSLFPLYIKDMSDTLGVVPGMGRFKVYKEAGFDYGISLGVLSFTPLPWLNFRLGFGKHFIGHGYRSLLVSDAAYNYPYVDGIFSLFKNRVQYLASFASIQGEHRLPLGEVPESLFEKKVATFHYLSWCPSGRIELGLFEGTVFRRADTSARVTLPWDAYNPIPGVNAARHGLHGEANVLAGADLRFKATDHLEVYGQYMIDDTRHNANGWQAGLRYFDLLAKNLDLQIEYNNVGGSSYASHMYNLSYAHTGQPLGHPAGGCTREFLVIADYRYHRFVTQVKFFSQKHGTDPSCRWTNDPDVVMETLVAFPESTVQQWDIQAGWFMNPKTNLQFLFGYTDRFDRLAGIQGADRHTAFAYVSLRTSLLNRYFDF